MKIALVHDYFTQRGGAEKVADELFHILPGAFLFATVALRDLMPDNLQNEPIVTSWMQHLPFMRKGYRFYVALYPLAVDSLDLSGYDLVVTSSSGYVKGVKTAAGAVHVCYCHTPMRWAWESPSYLAQENMGLLLRVLVRRMVHVLQWWDLRASRQPDFYVANSQAVADRIKRFYKRDAVVIHPPVDIGRFSPSDEQEDYYLVLARLVSYKRIDLAVLACTRLKKRLIVIGEGPDRHRLESMAGPSVSFLGRLSDSEVEHYASRCKALLFPGVEDFGMAPVEIAAAGRPTIAFRGGGAMETIVEGTTGIFFDSPDPDSLASAIERFEEKIWDQHVIREHASNFSTDVFRRKFLQLLDQIGCSLPNDRLIWRENDQELPKRDLFRVPNRAKVLHKS